MASIPRDFDPRGGYVLGALDAFVEPNFICRFSAPH
jgi:hypothetical protein